MKELKVLLIDDEEEFTSALAERLNLRGVRADTSSSGEDALKKIEADPPHVVLLDLLMPGLGGKELLGRIKAAHPGIAVILLTGHGPPGADEAACDPCDYLIKPVNIDELVWKIREKGKHRLRHWGIEGLRD